MTWEDAVIWLRSQQDRQDLVRACYYDDPLLDAAKRFSNSEEWNEVKKCLPVKKGRALDLGAGRGISSYALAKNGWDVTALEPDKSALVGAGAIRELVHKSKLPIRVVENYAEHLPFEDGTYDLVYGRQVLHHAKDLKSLCREVYRILKPGGIFIATREHVISHEADLSEFLNAHPLHRLYGGENAFLLKEYKTAIAQGGMSLVKVYGPFDSAINYFPSKREQWTSGPISKVLGKRMAIYLTDERKYVGRLIVSMMSGLLSMATNTPGRLFSFVAQKALN